MSATLGAILKQLEPDWDIRIYERLSDIAQESSNPWNNAGTGHSALCELNYTPENAPTARSTSRAPSRSTSSSRCRGSSGRSSSTPAPSPSPRSFINPTPHMSFVWGESNVEYLRKRYEALKDHPLFAGMEYSEDARGHPPVGPAHDPRPPQVAEDRRDAHARRHRHRLRLAHPPAHGLPRRARRHDPPRAPRRQPHAPQGRPLGAQDAPRHRPHPREGDRALRVRRRGRRRAAPAAEVGHQGDPRLRRLPGER